MTDWLRTTRHRHCPVCDRPDWCVVAADGSVCICMRSSEGAKRTIHMRDGQIGYLHALTDEAKVVVKPARRTPKYTITLPADNPDIPTLALRWHEHMHPDELDDLAAKLAVSTDSLRDYRTGYSPENRCYTWPMVNGKGRIVGIRTRYRDGSKRAIPGSHNGIFVPTRLIAGRDDPILVVEGPTDAAACRSMGFDAIGRPSNTGGVGDILAWFRSKQRPAVILRDYDEAGKQGAEQLKIPLADAAPWVKVIVPQKGKDVRDWLQQGATYELVCCQIRNATFFKGRRVSCRST